MGIIYECPSSMAAAAWRGGVKKASGHGVITIIKSQCTPFSAPAIAPEMDAENKGLESQSVRPFDFEV